MDLIMSIVHLLEEMEEEHIPGEFQQESILQICWLDKEIGLILWPLLQTKELNPQDSEVMEEVKALFIFQMDIDSQEFLEPWMDTWRVLDFT